MNIVEYAVRNKLRINTSKGLLTVEQVFELPLTSTNGLSLDSASKDVNRVLKNIEEESFVEAPSSKNTKAKKALELLIYVIKIKKEENKARRAAAAKAERKQRILKQKAKNAESEFDGMTDEELDELLDD